MLISSHAVMVLNAPVLVKCDVLLIFICIITERNTNNKKDYSYGYYCFTSCEITMAT
jgi:hypothetical protein